MLVLTVASLTLAMVASVDAVAALPVAHNNGNQTEVILQSMCLAPEWHIDYPGNDSHDRPAASYEACCELCKDDSTCGAYTWTNYQGGTCYLKHTRSRSAWNGALPDGSASVISAEVYRCASLIKDVYYDGNDLYTVPAARAESCCQYCSVSRLCRSFSWTDYNGGTCWLKEAGNPVPNPGVISALFY